LKRREVVARCNAYATASEVFRTKSHRVYCDGSGQVDAALGHPRVYYQIDDESACRMRLLRPPLRA
jgi:uncharacterized Zn-finger protein